jgi:hypothetical protein
VSSDKKSDGGSKEEAAAHSRQPTKLEATDGSG